MSSNRLAATTLQRAQRYRGRLTTWDLHMTVSLAVDKPCRWSGMSGRGFGPGSAPLGMEKLQTHGYGRYFPPPSQCPPHSPASSIGQSCRTDERFLTSRARGGRAFLVAGKAKAFHAKTPSGRERQENKGDLAFSLTKPSRVCIISTEVRALR